MSFPAAAEEIHRGKMAKRPVRALMIKIQRLALCGDVAKGRKRFMMTKPDQLHSLINWRPATSQRACPELLSRRPGLRFLSRRMLETDHEPDRTRKASNGNARRVGGPVRPRL